MQLVSRRLKRLNERGDTIVEVLISIAIVSLILGGAFVTANNSLKGNRSAHERQNALKIAESQVEQIKYLAGTNPDTLFALTVPSSYCLNGGLVAIDSTDPACKVNADGTPTSVEPAYSVAVSRSTNTFTVNVTWASLNQGQNSVQLKYRAYR
jgi:type II secretory pathway pseudopilin PulG